jgi:hypothetical protein
MLRFSILIFPRSLQIFDLILSMSCLISSNIFPALILASGLQSYYIVWISSSPLTAKSLNLLSVNLPSWLYLIHLSSNFFSSYANRTSESFMVLGAKVCWFGFLVNLFLK